MPRDDSTAERFDGDGQPSGKPAVAPFSAKLELLSTAARDPSLRGADQDVLTVLVDYVHHAKENCHPSVATVAGELRVGVRTVLRSLKRIEAAGYMSVETHMGPNGVNRYSFDWPRWRAQVATGARTARLKSSASNDGRPQVTPKAVTPEAVTPKTAQHDTRVAGNCHMATAGSVTAVTQRRLLEEDSKRKREEGVAVPGDAPALSLTDLTEDDLKDAVNLACEVEGTGARLCRAAGIINPDHLRDWRWNRKARRLTAEQLAAIAADPAVQSALRRLIAQAERSFHTSNLESSHA